jgi:hypothetical protein
LLGVAHVSGDLGHRVFPKAVTALAALITAWQHSQNRGGEQPCADSATPLPLSGTASETDRAG